MYLQETRPYRHISKMYVFIYVPKMLFYISESILVHAEVPVACNIKDTLNKTQIKDSK